MKLYIARDKDESLYLYECKPEKHSTIWHSSGFVEQLDTYWFPEVKWKDEEPTEVELVIKKKI